MKVPRAAAEWDCSFCNTLILLGRCNKTNSYNWKRVCNIERPMKPLFMRKSLIHIFSRKHINGNNAVKVDRRTKNKNVPDRLFCKIPQKEQKYKQVGKFFKSNTHRSELKPRWAEMTSNLSRSLRGLCNEACAQITKKKKKKCSNRETGLAVCWWKTNRRRKRSPNNKSNHSLASIGITPLMWHTWNAWAVIELVKQKKKRKEKRLKTKV